MDDDALAALFDAAAHDAEHGTDTAAGLAEALDAGGDEDEADVWDGAEPK